MATIEFKGIEKTPLHEGALRAVLGRYWRGRKSKLVISFTERLRGVYAQYWWDGENRQHRIDMVPSMHHHVRRPTLWSPGGPPPHTAGLLVPLHWDEQAMLYMHSLLHELRHAQQRHRHGSRWADPHPMARTPELNYWFNKWEMDARSYADRHFLKAWSLYCSVGS
jgi:hypothetical protein